MDLVSRASSSPINSPPGPSLFGAHLHSSDTSFPIIAIAIIGILATAFLLVGYYIFVIKCCLTWHRIDILRRFTLSRNRNNEDPLMASAYSSAMEPRGLDESVIRAIPIFKFKNREFGGKTFCECAVCLNEFQQDEKLRIIPNCSHVFHIDCIDIWLQNNANCPLCRTSISIHSRFQLDHIIAPSTSPQDPNPYSESLIGGDEDFVVIELGSHRSTDQTQGEVAAPPRPVSPSPRKTGQKKARKFNKVTSMGDECINIRGKEDDQFKIQPIRRSFSMDSSGDRQLYLAIQEIVQSSRQVTEVSPCSSSSTRIRRNFFSFGNGRGGSRSAVLPVYLD